MQIINSVKDLDKFLKQSNEINFVPTMGNLHAGHLSLVSEANKYNGITLVSIFVNPLQFAPNEDLDVYPRTEKKDLIELEKANCDAVFFQNLILLKEPKNCMQTQNYQKNFVESQDHTFSMELFQS